MKKREAHTRMLYELETLQNGLRDDWLSDSLPLDWSGMEFDDPSPRPLTRVTIRLDSEMVRWFRRMGPGYGPRMNRILMIWWLALLGGGIKAFPADDNIPRLLNKGFRKMEKRNPDVFKR